jgi:hypothetical protein
MMLRLDDIILTFTQTAKHARSVFIFRTNGRLGIGKLLLAVERVNNQAVLFDSIPLKATSLTYVIDSGYGKERPNK